MKPRFTRQQARDKATEQAPPPSDSPLIYAVVAVSLALCALPLGAAFYGLDLLSQPVLIVAVLAVALVGALLLHKVRRLRHRAALAEQYQRVT